MCFVPFQYLEQIFITSKLDVFPRSLLGIQPADQIYKQRPNELYTLFWNSRYQDNYAPFWQSTYIK